MHPRTILRALTREKHPYWTPDYDPVVRLAEVAVVFNCSPALLRAVHHEGIKLYKQDEAAAYVKMPLRTFRNHYRPKIWCGDRVHRFTKDQLDKIRKNGKA